MRRISVIATGVAVAAAAWAGDAAQTEQRTVAVCISRGGDVAVLQAQTIASQLFARIGVGTDWQDEHRSCADKIAITLSEDTPGRLDPGQFAYSLPYQGKRIVVFYDRMRKVLTGSRVPSVLGYVLAHEIAHILQGISRHSASGIMKPKWEPRDYSGMRERELSFTEDDVYLIHKGLVAQ